MTPPHPDWPQVRGVLFDYGGVLTGPVKDSLFGWLASDGIDPGSFSETVKAWLGRTAPDGTPIHRLETGELAEDEFERLLAGALRRLDGSPVPAEGILQRMFERLRPDPAMFALAEDLVSAGIRVGILSNSWGDIYPRELLASFFDPIVISSEVSLRKPHPEVFGLALERLGLAASEVVFIDDAEPNVAGARRAGLHAFVHADATTTRQQLKTLLPSPTALLTETRTSS